VVVAYLEPVKRSWIIGVAKHCLDKHVLASEHFHRIVVPGMEEVLPLTLPGELVGAGTDLVKPYYQLQKPDYRVPPNSRENANRHNDLRRTEDLASQRNVSSEETQLLTNPFAQNQMSEHQAIRWLFEQRSWLGAADDVGGTVRYERISPCGGWPSQRACEHPAVRPGIR